MNCDYCDRDYQSCVCDAHDGVHSAMECILCHNAEADGGGVVCEECHKTSEVMACKHCGEPFVITQDHKAQFGCWCAYEKM
jgi:hypothetical protein